MLFWKIISNFNIMGIMLEYLTVDLFGTEVFTLSYCFFSMEGGELFQRIQDRQDGAFTERGEICETVGLPFYSSLNCLFVISLLLV